MIDKPYLWVKEITSTKTPANQFSEGEWKLFEPFIINRFIASNAKLLELVNYIQGLNIQDKKQLYTIYCEFCPRDNKYYPYLKKSAIKENTELIDILKVYFELSAREIKDALSLLDKDVIESILTDHGYDKKEIKKLIKGI